MTRARVRSFSTMRIRSCTELLRRGQRHARNRTGSELALQHERSAVVADNAIHDRQPEPAAIGEHATAAYELALDRGQLVGGDPRSVIRHLDDYAAAGPSCRDPKH